MTKLFALIFLAASSISWASTFDDCLLKNLPKAQTESAVKLVTQACRNKFPQQTKTKVCRQVSATYETVQSMESMGCGKFAVTNKSGSVINKIEYRHFYWFGRGGFKDYSNEALDVLKEMLEKKPKGAGISDLSTDEKKRLSELLYGKSHSNGCPDYEGVLMSVTDYETVPPKGTEIVQVCGRTIKQLNYLEDPMISGCTGLRFFSCE